MNTGESEDHLSFVPIFAQSRAFQKSVPPVAFDCVKLMVIRAGSAVLYSGFGERPVTVGDVIVLAGNTLCGSEPEGSVTVTTLYLDTDYIVDQVFWQYASMLADRLDAHDFMEARYAEPAQILHLGEDRVGYLMPWLDELVALSLRSDFSDRFYRVQSLLFAVLDVVAPFVKVTPVRSDRHSRAVAASIHRALRRSRPGTSSADRSRIGGHSAPGYSSTPMARPRWPT